MEGESLGTDPRPSRTIKVPLAPDVEGQRTGHGPQMRSKTMKSTAATLFVSEDNVEQRALGIFIYWGPPTSHQNHPFSVELMD